LLLPFRGPHGRDKFAHLLHALDAFADSTPLQTSTRSGWAMAMAWRTLAACKPPASQSLADGNAPRSASSPPLPS